jgi:hypothetical protein
MAMIPTDEVITLQACGGRDVQGVGVSISRQDRRGNVAVRKRFHRFTDWVNCVMRRADPAADFSRISWGCALNFGKHNIGDRACAV